MDLFSALSLLLLFAAGILLLRHEGVLDTRRRLCTALLLMAAAMFLRGLCLPHRTLDYENFLALWVDYFRHNGGWRALSHNLGNYNVPYLYFLALFSYLKVPDLYLIKLLSIAFDVLLAWGVLRLVRHFRAEARLQLAAFFAALCLPTVLLNGAYWGQCDSIYVAFAVWSLVYVLGGHPIRGLIAIALSFAFKLQAVFFMPAFLIFLFAKKVRWEQLLVFPATYILVVLPAVLIGRPFKETLLLYFDQAGSIGGGLNYNSSSVFAFANAETNVTLWSRLGILFAFLFLLEIFFQFYRRRHAITDRALLLVSTLMAVGIPLLLPHMHDRYFFMADVFSLALAFVMPRLLPVPPLVSFASLLGYHAYLKMRYLLPMSCGATALIVVVGLLIAALVVEFRRAQGPDQNHGGIINGSGTTQTGL